jgi:hypothetical protein
MEIRQAIVALHILNTQSDLSERQGFVLVQVSKTDLNNTALQTIGCNLSTSSLGNKGLSAVLDGKDRRCNELVPFLLEKRVNRLFTATLLTLRKTLILSL